MHLIAMSRHTGTSTCMDARMTPSEYGHKRLIKGINVQLTCLSYSTSAGMLGALRELVQGSSRPLMKGCSGLGRGS